MVIKQTSFCWMSKRLEGIMVRWRLLAHFIFIYSRIYTTKPDKTVKDVVIIVNNLWRGLWFQTEKKTQAIPYSPPLIFQAAAPTVKQSWKNCRSRGRSAQSRSFQYDGGANTIFRTEIVRWHWNKSTRHWASEPRQEEKI